MTEGISPDIKRAYNRARYEKSRSSRRRYYLEHREERLAYQREYRKAAKAARGEAARDGA